MEPTDTFVLIGSFASEKAAITAASSLAERGIGAQPMLDERTAPNGDAAGVEASAAPGDTAALGDTEASGDVTSPGETEVSGDVAALGDTEASGDVTSPGETAAPADYALAVLPEDLVRACEILGVDVPADIPEPEPPRPPWKILLLIWLAALVIIPLFAFWLTLQLAG